MKLKGCGALSTGRLVRLACSGSCCLLAVLTAGLLTGCPAGPHGPGPSGTPVAATAEPGPRHFPRHEGRPFDVISSESLLVILAYRGGALALAGHNHVIASHDLNGTIYVPADAMRSTLEIHVPVADLKIDEPALRAAEGPDFPADVPDSAKEGTRRNMLGAALLNGSEYPEIGLTCEHIESGTGGAPLRADVQVSIRGQSHMIVVPVQYELRDDQITASGNVPLRQSELGLTPFNFLHGALQVQDELRVKFRIVARAANTRGR